MTLNAYLNRFRSGKFSNSAMSWNTWDILTALFPVLQVFWQNNKASMVENSLENLCKCHFRDSKFQNVPRCLGPQELIQLTFDVSSKAAYYSSSSVDCSFLPALTSLVTKFGRNWYTVYQKFDKCTADFHLSQYSSLSRKVTSIRYEM